jgi:hypothetical protein
MSDRTASIDHPGYFEPNSDRYALKNGRPREAVKQALSSPGSGL